VASVNSRLCKDFRLNVHVPSNFAVLGFQVPGSFGQNLRQKFIADLARDRYSSCATAGMSYQKFKYQLIKKIKSS
jgi:hypothetical protein